MTTIELTELIPWMDETPITEQTFIDFGFKREDVSAEESGDEPFHYYVYDFGDIYAPSLFSEDNFTSVSLLGFENFKKWKTVGELKTLMALLHHEN